MRPDHPQPLDINPNQARYNDWRSLDAPPLDAFAPTLPVSVIVPYFEAPRELAQTLAALERQTYPRHLFEVVIVDDGSQTPLTPPPSTLDVRVVRREKAAGFSLAAARNAGAAAAAHPILVFLDDDLLPEAECLAAHARWHHVVSDALTVSSYTDVNIDDVPPAAIRNRSGSLAELFSGREFAQSWMQNFIHNTNGLTKIDAPLFESVVGTFGIGKAFYESVGGFDESFIRYGFEDTEFGYRAYARGALLIPDENTHVWHNRPKRQVFTPGRHRENELQRAKITHLIVHPRFRSSAPGRIFTIPQHVVTVQAGDKPHRMIAKDVEAILADPAGDLAVRIELAEKPHSYRTLWLQEQYGPDARVSIAAENAALDDFPLAAFHLSLPAGAYENGLVQQLRTILGNAVTARMALPNTGVATITRTWALHRSRRTGLPVERFGDVASPLSANAMPPNVGTFRRMLREVRSVRDAQSAARFLKRLARRVLNRLMRVLRSPAGARAGQGR